MKVFGRSKRRFRLLIDLGFGAASAYLFDPEHGAERRARLAGRGLDLLVEVTKRRPAGDDAMPGVAAEAKRHAHKRLSNLQKRRHVKPTAHTRPVPSTVVLDPKS